jgi:hypothetical protein
MSGTCRCVLCVVCSRTPAQVPTQEFFAQDMGLALEMKPNYEDFSCQFSFGKTPLPQAEDAAFNTPCFQQCPTARRSAAAAAAAAVAAAGEADGPRCHNIELDKP